MELEECEQVLRAIDSADAPICIGSSNDLAIYRSDWAEELLDGTEDVSEYKYWIDSAITSLFLPLNSPEELASFFESC